MPVLEKFEQFNRKISAWAQWIGFGALFLMVALTCVDVFGAKVFRSPVFGAIDAMMLAQIVAISFAASMTLIMDRHVEVEFFMLLFPKRIQAAVDAVIQFLCFVLFVIVVWRLFMHGHHLQTGGEESMTARIPLHPFAYAAAIAIIPLCLVLLQKCLSSFIRAVKKDES